MSRILSRLAIVLTLLAGLVAAPTAAFAASPNNSTPDATVAPMSMSQCPAASICVWNGTAFTGAFASTTSYSTTATNLDGGVAYSIMNTSDKAAYLFSGPLGSGTRICIQPGVSASQTSVGAVSYRLSVYYSC